MLLKFIAKLIIWAKLIKLIIFQALKHSDQDFVRTILLLKIFISIHGTDL